MRSLPSLAGKVAVVTGASRGIGKGIATLLGEWGATVYVSGRTTDAAPNATFGTINEVADAITAAGGVGIAVRCDHADDGQIKGLFERVNTEQGHLDILVNNATTIGADPLAPPPFWNKSIAIADQFTVGLRSAFVASYYAAPLLIAADKALVVNISYYGAVSYHLDPAYGATKRWSRQANVRHGAGFRALRGCGCFALARSDSHGESYVPDLEGPRRGEDPGELRDTEILRARYCFALCRSQIDVEVRKRRHRSRSSLGVWIYGLQREAAGEPSGT